MKPFLKEIVGGLTRIILLHQLGYFFQKKYNFFRIITYHSIPSAGEFMRHLERIEKSGFDFVHPSFLKRSVEKKGVPCIITFDDCFIDQFDKALFALEEKGLKGIFFCTPGLLGKKNYMDWHHLKEILKLGHWIGSHSFSHPNFSRLSLSEAKRELEYSKKILEDRLSCSVECFAFPFGTSRDFNLIFVEEAHLTGYSFIFSSVRGGNRLGEECYFRDSIDPGWSANLCIYFLSGTHQILSLPVDSLKRVVRRISPFGYEYSFFKKFNLLEKIFIRIFGLVDLSARTRFYFLTNIIKHLEAGKILDVGTGPGLFPMFVLRKGIAQRALGIDISDEWLKEARRCASLTENRGVAFERCNVEEDELPHFDADLLTAVECIQYFKNPEITLPRLLSRVKKGGYALFHFHEKDVRDLDLWRMNKFQGEDVERVILENNFSIIKKGRGPSPSQYIFKRVFKIALKFKPLLLIYPLLILFSKIFPYEHHEGEYYFILAKKKVAN